MTHEFGKTEIDKMLNPRANEMIETKWIAVMVLTPKKDGSLRFCVI